ncbi:hypothetical protein BLA13014_04123 [Burkholderia aenigmatica]|uniref:Uncharacterized protein n=1 Tax=Burkholderia aenigmatica TaxID=2015348 RepID=A0A6P2N241_9BURK|nr:MULTISPECIES: hypothetical protein [Burkholderia]VWB89019.1 hypothetical protein BLA13014_04123 [Burkholderia aenigmatica]
MGEIAEMMLDGTLCEGCGDYLGDDGDGSVRRCEACGPLDVDDAYGAPMSKKVRCCHCPRLVTRTGLKDHMDAKHPGVQHDAKTRCPICNKSVKTVGLPQHMRATHKA